MTRPTGELTRRELAIRELAKGRAVLVVAQKVQATEAEVQALASSFGDWPKSVKGIRAAAAAIEQGDTSWASDDVAPDTRKPELAELPDDWDAAVVDQSAEVPDDLDAVVDRQDIAEAAARTAPPRPACPDAHLHLARSDDMWVGDRATFDGLLGTVVECKSCRSDYVLDPDEEQPGPAPKAHEPGPGEAWAQQRARELDETLAEQAAAEEAEEQARADVDPARVMAALADAHSVLARVGRHGFTGGALPGVDEVLAEPVPRLAETLRMSLGELVLGDGQRIHLGWAEVDVRVSPAGLLAALAGDAGTDAVAVDVRAAWEPAAAVAVRRLAAALPPEVA